MKRKISLVIAVLLLTACRTEDAQESAPKAHAGDPPVLTAHGWGPLEIGMSRDEVVAAAGEDANPGLVGGPDPERCDEFRPKDAPQGMRVMIEQGVLTRISISRDADVKTAAGFGLGDEASGIKAHHGERAEALPHQYQSLPAEYILVWEGAGSRGTVYEIGGDGRVSQIHVGTQSIRRVEGCV